MPLSVHRPDRGIRRFACGSLRILVPRLDSLNGLHPRFAKTVRAVVATAKKAGACQLFPLAWHRVRVARRSQADRRRQSLKATARARYKRRETMFSCPSVASLHNQIGPRFRLRWKRRMAKSHNIFYVNFPTVEPIESPSLRNARREEAHRRPRTRDARRRHEARSRWTCDADA